MPKTINLKYDVPLETVAKLTHLFDNLKTIDEPFRLIQAKFWEERLKANGHTNNLTLESKELASQFLTAACTEQICEYLLMTRKNKEKFVDKIYKQLFDRKFCDRYYDYDFSKTEIKKYTETDIGFPSCVIEANISDIKSRAAKDIFVASSRAIFYPGRNANGFSCPQTSYVYFAHLPEKQISKYVFMSYTRPNDEGDNHTMFIIADTATLEVQQYDPSYKPTEFSENLQAAVDGLNYHEIPPYTKRNKWVANKINFVGAILFGYQGPICVLLTLEKIANKKAIQENWRPTLEEFKAARIEAFKTYFKTDNAHLIFEDMKKY